MSLVPALLDRWLLAGLLLLPAGALLTLAGISGDAGRVSVGLVVVAALLYGGVTWLAGPRRELAARLPQVAPAPEGARLEPVLRTTGRNTLKALAFLAVALVTALAHVLVAGVALAAGVGLTAAFTAARLQAWESEHVGRLARAPDGALVVV